MLAEPGTEETSRAPEWGPAILNMFFQVRLAGSGGEGVRGPRVAGDVPVAPMDPAVTGATGAIGSLLTDEAVAGLLDRSRRVPGSATGSVTEPGSTVIWTVIWTVINVGGILVDASRDVKSCRAAFEAKWLETKMA